MYKITDLNPKIVFDIFAQIASVPHGSGNTKAISDLCVDYAKKNKCKFVQDTANNVIIFVDGTEGYEQSEPVILQGHIDMVCDKTDNCTKNMDTEGLELRTDGVFLWAEQTTLGGDDGIAVAYMLALLEDKSIPHPPLELLFTSDEEIGMLGARVLDTSCLNARKLINIDSENEGILTVSCAGGVRASCKIPIIKEKTINPSYQISISGLRGGHSGVEINKGRINANKIMEKILNSVFNIVPFQIVHIQGGKKSNAIPNEAEAVLCVKKSSGKKFLYTVKHFSNQLKHELSATEPNLRISCTPCDPFPECMDMETTKNILFALSKVPNGVQTMSPDIPNMVQTSLNMGVLTTESDCISMQFLIRSNASAGKQVIIEKLQSFVKCLCGKIEFMSDYPAWEYRPDSELRTLMVNTYTRLFEVSPEVTAIHAGLECGILAGKIENMDAVSFGPNILNAHTPQEKMDIASVERCWEYLKAVLKQMKN